MLFCKGLAGMFDRLRPGFLFLIGWALLTLCLTLPLGVANLSTYFSLDGLTKTLIPAWSLFPLVWVGYIALALIKRGAGRPFSAMRRVFYLNRHWLGRCSAMAIMLVFIARSVSGYKSQIPVLMPYWADPHLVYLDNLIFGVDPWRITHFLIGPLGTVILDRIYALWAIVMMVTLGWFCFTRNIKLQLRGLLTSLLSWTLLSDLLATVLASVGPCYYRQFFGDGRFDPLMAKLQAVHADQPLLALRAMEVLLKFYGKNIFGAGISAMPSLHVAMAAIAFLALISYSRQRWLKVIGGIYAAAIFIGSIHLGWHYAVDGIASIVAVIFFWWATGKFVDWLDVRDRARTTTVPAPAPLPSSLPASA